jgi:GntR family transcriptional regulator, transcriptional repressor for pyruvate dehydrogenase complex
LIAKISKNSVADSIINEIRRLIMSGELKAGEKLPDQIRLAKQLGVSRVSLREALMTLSQLGAIEQRPGKGTFLVARAPALMAGEMEVAFMSDAEATLELNEVRNLMEVGIIRLAVERATDEEITEIGHVLERMRQVAEKGDLEDYREQDFIFHDRLASAAHNRFVMHLFKSIRQAFHKFLEESFAAMPQMIEKSLIGHEAVFAALKSRNSKAAVVAMADHLAVVQQAIEAYYRQK